MWVWGLGIWKVGSASSRGRKLQKTKFRGSRSQGNFRSTGVGLETCMEQSSWQVGVQVWRSEEVSIRDTSLSSVQRCKRGTCSQKRWLHVDTSSLAAPVSLAAQPALFTPFHLVTRPLAPMHFCINLCHRGFLAPRKSRNRHPSHSCLSVFCAALVL